ncbi:MULTISPECIES: Flp pilus assembly protein CpaB [unclassified Kribbella]|uniref:Flp pilus assembly protein CpaB n=1 Tax=unclassified Kribbella TaxID=2644121 RepID=UPI003016E18F
MKRRVITIVLAATLAIVGTLAVLVYVLRADARAVAGQQAVTVLVVDKAIPSGTTAAEAKSKLRKETLPASSVASDALSEITAEQDDLVTSADLKPGQLLLGSMLVSEAQATGDLTIPDGKVAVTITLCSPEMVAGNVRAGSEVAVFGTLVTGGTGDVTAQPNCTGQHKQQVGKGIGNTRVVIPKVKVLSIGPATPPTPKDDAKVTNTTLAASTAGPQQDMTLVTFAVNQDDAERLILLTQTGLPYLALLGPSATIKPDDHIVPQFPPPPAKKK